MKLFSRLLMLVTVLSGLLSCSPVKMVLDKPAGLPAEFNMIKIAGVKGKALPGAKRTLKFENYFSGEFKDGWSVSSDLYRKAPDGLFSEQAIARRFLVNFGIGINNVSSTSKDKFQFTISDSSSSDIVFCNQLYVGESKSYQFRNNLELSKGERQFSMFNAAIMPLEDLPVAEWLLALQFERETPRGILATTLREGMPVETGFLTDKKDTIQISPLFIRQSINAKTNTVYPMPFPLVGGYEFKLGEKVMGVVDLFNSTVGFDGLIEPTYKRIIAAASTAILLRNR